MESRSRTGMHPQQTASTVDRFGNLAIEQLRGTNTLDQ